MVGVVVLANVRANQGSSTAATAATATAAAAATAASWTGFL